MLDERGPPSQGCSPVEGAPRFEVGWGTMGAMRPVRWATAVAFLAALASGAAGPALAAEALVSVGDELSVGKNRTGEACRLKLVERRTDPGGFRRYNLCCDGWTQPSGDIRSFGVSKEFTVTRLLTDSAWEKS